LVEYLYDTGADTSIMQKCLYETILKEDNQTRLIEYKGNLRSVTSEIKTIGKINLNKCLFNIKNNINNVEIIVIEDQECTNKCIIGTDLMNQIPEFKNLLEMVEETIKSMSNDILLQHSNKFVSNHDLKQISKINESLTDNITQIGTTDVTINKMNQVRENLKVKLAECSASELVDIIPKAKTRVEFKIKLINPKQRPLESRARTLPFHMHDKVKKQIDELLE
jgi:hypothetical protein